MAIRRASILTLAGAAFPQMNTSINSMLDSTIPSADNTGALFTGRPNSLIDNTAIPTMVADTTSGIYTGSDVDNLGYSSAVTDSHRHMNITAIVKPSITNSFPAITIVATGAMTTPSMGGAIGTGGLAVSNASATTTGQPIRGDSTMSGVSIGFFVISLALTALLQL
ncbi:hypothetical protein SAMD00023353_0201770 [Rosellinia necatrix]|uniref:Uncharacterized protein n=1 Tax=Rosellinia necatrix TaxID=77044 RepID=A0A1S7ULY8_ROSNE|nr:hypothetical protein SAMD00023353_0201770 [Rosellinia necatrix]